MLNESLVILILLGVAGPPAPHVGNNALLTSHSVGTVTKYSCNNNLHQCLITTSEHREFVVQATETNVAEKGAQLLLLSVGRKGEQQLCNMAGGVCARVINEK